MIEINYENIQSANEFLKNYDITTSGECINKRTRNIKKTFISKNGYERVTLWNKGKSKKYSIHQLVAIKYIPNPNNYKNINHKDGNKLNNNVDNLEWCTTSQNIRRAYKNNLIKPHTTKVVQYSKKMEKIKEWDSITEVENILKINHANIVTVCKQNTNRKYAGGFIWRYE